MKLISDNRFFSRKTLLPLGLIAVVSLVLVFLTIKLDELASNTTLKVVDNLFLFNYITVFIKTNILSSIIQIYPAVISLFITVIAIIIQLNSNKYSSKIVDFFIQDKTNQIILLLSIVASIYTIAIGGYLKDRALSNIVPVGVTLFLVISLLLISLPYFNYILNFFKPENVFFILQHGIIHYISLYKKYGDNKKSHAKLEKIKLEIVEYIDVIGDIILKSTTEFNRSLSTYGLRKIEEIYCFYIENKNELPETWFIPPDTIEKSNLDMNRKWFEVFLFKHFEIILIKSLNEFYDIGNHVGKSMRNIGYEAIDKGEVETNETGEIRTIMKMFNTSLKDSINKYDRRTTYNLLYHYSLFAERILERDLDSFLIPYFEHLKYYAMLAYHNQVAFIVDTICFDMKNLIQKAFHKDSPYFENYLYNFLKLSEMFYKEGGFNMNMMKTKSVLAAFFIFHEREDVARIIFNSLKKNMQDQMQTVFFELYREHEEEFFEFTDRFVNFNFVQKELKDSILKLQSWFDEPEEI
ncbi:MAG: hypothetical protein A2Y41_09060 [Spirochaetes bacterium GWB1_36_13]|nr:MAG: hypothetical protein A2Y41_09060 [Spirochaetes bacterium GWB1_36_13]